jgi:hypothetical protein
LSQFFPAVSSSPDGKFVIVWSDNDRDGPFDNGVFGQRFDTGGVPAGTEFQAHTYTTYGQAVPRVASAADGSFVVVWVSRYQDGDYEGIEGQRFDAGGAPTGTEFQVQQLHDRASIRARGLDRSGPRASSSFGPARTSPMVKGTPTFAASASIPTVRQPGRSSW